MAARGGVPKDMGELLDTTERRSLYGLAAEVRAVEEGHNARVLPDGSVLVKSESHPGSYRVVLRGIADGVLRFGCATAPRSAAPACCWPAPSTAAPPGHPGHGRRRLTTDGVLCFPPPGYPPDSGTRERVRGPRWVPASHGLGTMPLYLRKGAVIPMGSVTQWVGS